MGARQRQAEPGDCCGRIRSRVGRDVASGRRRLRAPRSAGSTRHARCWPSGGHSGARSSGVPRATRWLDAARRSSGWALRAGPSGRARSTSVVPGRRPAARGELTPTERRVVELAAGGLANKQIATTLFVTVHTVEVHLARAYAKLGVRSRAQLAARLAARRAGDDSAADRAPERLRVSVISPASRWPPYGLAYARIRRRTVLLADGRRAAHIAPLTRPATRPSS